MMLAKRLLSTLKWIGPTAGQLIAVVAVIAAAALAYNAGVSTTTTSSQSTVTSETPDGSAHADTATIWTCSMHPEIKWDHPGKCPICGMELVPVEAEDGASGPAEKESAEPVGWACAMNCVPPMRNPGKCPICGMDMVPVEGAGVTRTGSAPRYVMSEEARALARIETDVVRRQYVTHLVRMVGRLDYDETRVKEITAYVGGRLDRLYVDYEGIPVRKDDHMVYLYSPDLLTTQDDLRIAKAALESLLPTSRPSLMESRKRSVESVRERLRLWGLLPQQIREIEKDDRRFDHVTIYAPMGGIVLEKHKQEGDYVKEGDSIYTIADLSHLWLRMEAYETDLPWLRFGQEVVFTTEAYPGEEFSGRIAFIQPTLDAMSRTVDVRVNAPNEDGRLKPEMYVRASVASELAKGGKVIDPNLAGKWICPMHPEVAKDGPGDCGVCGMDLVRAEDLGFVAAARPSEAPLTVPASAVLITGKRAVTYVKVPGADRPTYEGREIIVGPRAGDYYLILEGLSEGESVVTNGAFKIDSALQIMAKPSMMNPEGGATSTGHGQHGSASESSVDHTGHEMNAAEMTGTTTSFAVSSEFLEALSPTYNAYFAVQQALSADNLTKAKEAFETLGESSTSLEEPGGADHSYQVCNAYLTEVQKSAVLGGRAESLAEAREAFVDASEAIISMEDAFGHAGSDPHVRFRCPMALDNKGAEWLQTSEKTLNPFFGESMLNCGVVVATYDSDNNSDH